MSAIWMRCSHCDQAFVAGVVGKTPWPKHVCPDGTEGALAEMTFPLLAVSRAAQADPKETHAD